MASDVISEVPVGDIVLPSISNSDVTTTSVDTAANDASEDAKLRAVRQIEFYFDDTNLPYDRFMWTLHTANEEHWVPIATVAGFKRMKEYRVNGIPWIAGALQSLSTELEVDPSLEKCRRKHEVKEVDPSDLMERSVYAKGFGEEHPTLQLELENFFGKYGTVRSVRMRRNDETKAFKGSVFVEFDTPLHAKSFLNESPKPIWKDTPLLLYSKKEYCEMKIKEKGLTGKAAQNKRTTTGSNPLGRRGFNAFREMAKSSGKKDEKEEVEAWLDFMGKRIKILDEDGEAKIDEEEYETVPRATLQFSGCKGECQWSDIKDPVREHFGRAPYIKFQRGDDSGIVGFDRTVTEEDLEYVKERVKTVGGVEVVWSFVDEEVNREYQLERANAAAKRALNGAESTSGARGNRGRGRGRGRGNRGRGRGRSDRDRSRRDTSVQNKDKTTTALPEENASAGSKRTRGVEPDGGITEGVRGEGAAMPVIVSVSGGGGSSVKRVRVDE